MSIFTTIKNNSISKLAKKYINGLIEEYGNLENLQIDSTNKNIYLEILLHGETKNIEITIEKYEVIRKDDSAFIKFKKISTSREWIDTLIMNVVIPNFAYKKKIEIDPSYAKIIDLLL